MNNYFVNLFVTDKCNFKCRYCYEKGGNKGRKNMTQATADDVIRFIERTIGPDQQLIVSFHGGEPVLRFELIKYMVEKIRRVLPNEAIFGITTNGSLLNDEMVEYLAENMRYKLSISIDGDECTQNFNRLHYGDSASYGEIMGYAAELRNRNPLFTIRMTYDRYNIYDLYRNIRYFIDNGFDRIIAEADFMSREWEQGDFEVIYEQFLGVKQYICGIKDRHITVYPINSPDICLSPCTAGHDYFTISSSGKLYPCTMVVNDRKFCLGDVRKGVDIGALYKTDRITSCENEGCRQCTRKQFCTAYRCCFLNYASTGDYYSPNLVMCNLMSIRNRLDSNERIRLISRTYAGEQAVCSVRGNEIS